MKGVKKRPRPGFKFTSQIAKWLIFSRRSPNGALMRMGPVINVVRGPRKKRERRLRSGGRQFQGTGV